MPSISLKKSARKALRKRISKRNLFNLIWAIFRGILLFGLVFMILYPLIVKFSTSIKSVADQANPSVMFIPEHPTLRNYKVVYDVVEYPKTLMYTILFTGFNSLLQIASCSMVAYGLARFKFKLNKPVFALTILTLIIPPQALLLPTYLRFKYFNPLQLFKFSGGLSGLDITGTVLPFFILSLTAMALKNGLYIFMLRQYFRNIPDTLEEAAYVDGSGIFHTFIRIMLPGALPIILSMFLFSFVWQWNDNYYVTTLANNLPTLGNKLFGLQFSVLGDNSDIFNAVLNTPKFYLLILPLIVLYIFTQRFFIESIEKSGTVG